MIHILAVVFILVGIGLTSTGIYNIVEASKSKRWPSTAGAILKSGVKETRWGEAVDYSTDIEYTYTVGDKHYLASRITWASENLSGIKKDEAEKKVSDYPPGKTVTVFYDPKDPTIAVLDGSLTLRVHVPWIIGLLLMAAGFGLYTFGSL
jgi:hypothetical protein